MHRLGTHPARLRRESAHAIQKLLQASANGIVDVEGNEDAHRQSLAFVVGALVASAATTADADQRLLYINFLLTMSSAS